jgi:hypothetical protein
MDKRQVISTIIDFISKQFPRRCPCCGKKFSSLSAYLQQTTHIGKPVSYDADIGDWNPTQPLGSVSIANCTCGTSLAISSKGINVVTLTKLMHWVRVEAEKKGVTISDVLLDIRNEIDNYFL